MTGLIRSKFNAPQSQKLKRGFLILLVVVVLWEVGRMLVPFAGAIVAAISLGVVFFPFHRWVTRLFSKRSPNFNSLLSCLAVFLFFVVPFSLLTWTALSQATKIGPVFKEFQQVVEGIGEGETVDSIPTMHTIRRWVASHWGIPRAQFQDYAVKILNSGIATVSAVGGRLAKGAFSLALGLALVTLTLFFVFRDGPAFYAKSMSYVPLEPEVKTYLAENMGNTIHSVLRGWFLTALAQGVVASIGYAIAGVPSAVLLGVLTSITGLIPTIGTALVWFPAGLVLLSQGSIGSGVFLLIYGFFVISMIDNVLRPFLVGSRADLPFLYLVFALLGGIEVWGLKGIILGPLLITVAPIVLEAFHKSRPSPVGRSPSSE